MKKSFLLVAVASLVLFGSLQLCLYVNRPTSLNELRSRAAVLPGLQLTTLSGRSYDMEENLPLVLIYFNSLCDHCQRQVDWLKRERQRFEGISIVLMSSQPEAELQAFMEAINLGDDQFTLVRVRAEELAEKFGALALPQIFVFDRNRKLVELFAGETDPEKIRSTLP